MAKATKEPKASKSLKKNTRPSHLPSKISVNLASVEKKKIQVSSTVPAVILIVAIAFAFGKFAVADRLMQVSRAEAEVAALERELDEGYKKIDSFGELNELYAHYTYSGMTKEEASRPDRASAIEMLRKVVMTRGYVHDWNLSGNILTVTFDCENLEAAKRVAQAVEEDPHVDFCSVNTAATSDKNRNEYVENGISARLTIYLKPAEEAKL